MVKNAIKVYARLKPEKDKKNILVSISCEYRIEVLSSFLFFQGLRNLVPSQEESGGRFLDSRLPHTKMQGLPWQSARIVEFLVRYHYIYILVTNVRNFKTLETFSFYRIFEESSTQDEIFENVARPVIER